MPSVSKRGRRAAPRWVPPIVPAVVLDPPPAQAPPPAPEVAAPGDPGDRAWDHPEQHAQGNPAKVMLWLVIPFVAVILWSLFFDSGAP